MSQCLLYLMKRVGVGDVIDDDGDGRVSNVGRDETPEPLLTGRVPQLQPDRSVLQVHRLGEEVDADGGLVGVVERVVHEPGDEGRLADGLLAQEHELELSERVVERISCGGHRGEGLSVVLGQDTNWWSLGSSPFKV